MITRDRCGLYAEGGREGAPSAVQINDRYHLMSNLAEAVEREVQQLQVQARAELAGNVEAKRSGRATLIEARRQRCRQARYEKYLAVVELGRQGHTQLAIAEKFGIGAETVARWLRAPEFPERRGRAHCHTVRFTRMVYSIELCMCSPPNEKTRQQRSQRVESKDQTSKWLSQGPNPSDQG
jgi:hypothetical protein